MPEANTGADGAQAAPDTQPPAGDAEPQAGDAVGEDTSQPESISLDEARKLRSEASALRRRLKAFEDAEAQRKDADKTVEERAADRIKGLEDELAAERTARRTMAVQVSSLASARKLGFKDPELAARLIGASDVEFADDGSPKNVEKLLGDIAKEYPNLLNGTPDYGGGPRGPAPASGGTDMNRFIRQKAGRSA